MYVVFLQILNYYLPKIIYVFFFYIFIHRSFRRAWLTSQLQYTQGSRTQIWKINSSMMTQWMFEHPFIQLLSQPGMRQLSLPHTHCSLQESTKLYLLSSPVLSKMEIVVLVSSRPGTEALNTGCLSSYFTSIRKCSSEVQSASCPTYSFIQCILPLDSQK